MKKTRKKIQIFGFGAAVLMLITIVLATVTVSAQEVDPLKKLSCRELRDLPWQKGECGFHYVCRQEHLLWYSDENCQD